MGMTFLVQDFTKDGKMKKRKINRKVGIITHLKGKKFYISYGWKPSEARKTSRKYNRIGFSRVLNRNQFTKLKSHSRKKRITRQFVKSLVGR